MIRVEVSYVGRVQGVGFRATAQEIARAFPVAGWVRNEPDGTVRLAIEGPGADVERFLSTLRFRMGRHVEHVHRTRAEPQGEQGFEVR